MDTVNLADDVTRRGNAVARLTAATKSCEPIDATSLEALTAAISAQTQSAADLVRSMRDGDRY